MDALGLGGDLGDLLAQLQQTQERKASVKLSERNVVELIIKLKQLGLIGDDLLHTINGKEYITTDRLRRDIKAALAASGGRLELSELPALVGVDLTHCEKQVRRRASWPARPSAGDRARSVAVRACKALQRKAGQSRLRLAASPPAPRPKPVPPSRPPHPQASQIVAESGGSVIEAAGELITAQYFDSLAAEVDDLLQVRCQRRLRAYATSHVCVAWSAARHDGP